MKFVDVRLASFLLGSPLLLGAVALHAPALDPAPVGAPLVCFPIEVDAAAKLPVAGDGEDGRPSNVDFAALPALVVEALASSGDPQFHMELLRRAAMRTQSFDSGRRDVNANAADPWHDLVDRLGRAALLAAAEPESADAAARSRRALRFFDVGYALEVGETLGEKLGDGAPFLRKAAELAPDDAAVAFGVALPLFQDSLMARDDAVKHAAARACWVHLSRALVSDDPRLRRNVLRTFGAFLDCSTNEQLATEARRQLGGT